jgi:hypothetical protein
MENPQEHQSNASYLTVGTVDEIKELSARGRINLVSLTVRNTAIDFHLLAVVLQNNMQTLKILILNNSGDKITDVNFHSFKQFHQALQCCVNLDHLALNHFGHHLFVLQYPDIVNFICVTTSLPKLRILSFSGTYFSSIGFFFNRLRTNKSIKELNLENPPDSRALAYFHEVAGNTTLEKLILGQSQIELQYVLTVIKVITQGVINVLDWNPEAGYQTKVSDLKKELSSSDKSDGRKTDHASSYHFTKQQLQLNQYQRAYKLLQEAKKLTEARQQSPKKNVVIEIPDEEAFDLNLITTTILYHSSVVESLTIRMLNTARHDPSLSSDFELFLNALSQCISLHTLKIETFQSAFWASSVQALFKTISKLPLKFLSFKKTYIGPVGFQCLAQMAEQNKLVEIDLTLSGLVYQTSAEFLAECVSKTSLQRIILGKSPMTLKWWQMLTKARESNPARPKIEWQVSHEEEMKTKMRIMLNALAYDQNITTIDDDYEQFSSEVVDIEQQLQTFVSDRESVTGLLAVYGDPTSDERKKLINKSSSAPSKSYGATTPRPV